LVLKGRGFKPRRKAHEILAALAALMNNVIRRRPDTVVTLAEAQHCKLI